MKKVLFFMFFILLFVLTGCFGGGDTSSVKEAAIRYAENSMKGNWQEVIRSSTGEQLSVMTTLSERLENSKFTGEVRSVKVVDSSVNGKTATAVVRIVRDMHVKDYGTITDDRQVLYQFYNVDGVWKVYSVNVVLQNE